MEKNTQEELKAQLVATDPDFRRIVDEHAQYHRALEALEAKEPFTVDDEVEEHRLKKLKLKAKDQINEMLARYRAEHVGV